MALKGDLASVGLADVFQMLAHNQKVGILAVHGKDAWRAVYFDRRGVTLYYNEHSFLDRLLESLVRRSYIEIEVLDGLRRQNAGDPIGTVEALLSTGIVQEDVFLESFRGQMEEEIYDLFLWEKVHWEFLEGESTVEGREGVVNENFFFSADSLIMEAARRLDEWVFIREQVPGPWEVFESLPGATAREVVGLDDTTLAVHDLVDGRRNVQRIVEVSQLTAFQTNKSLSLLAQKGFIRRLPEEKLITGANECLAEARFEDALRLLERAVEVGAGLPEAYLLAAKTYEMQSELARAAWHYKCYARARIEYGGVDEGVTTLQHVAQMLPTDLEAWELLVHGLMLQQAPKLDPHAVGKDLIDLYLELDETERSRRLLEDLLKARPTDIELKKTLIAVYTKAGDTRNVMALYESIADDMVRLKDPIGAVRFLQKILMIDRNRRDISDRIKQLYVLDEKHRARRRNMILAVTGVLCFGTLATIYYLYDRNVRRLYEQLDPSAFVKEGAYDDAIRMYEEFLRRYPLTFVQGDVERDIDRIRGQKDLMQQQRDAEERKRSADARKKRQHYLDLWRQHESAIAQGLDMNRALERLQVIQKLALEAGEAVDRKWLDEHDVDRSLDSTREHLAKASQLAAQVEALMKEGKVDRARQLALELHVSYAYTQAAAQCLVPMRILTEPEGARVHLDGVLLTGESGEALTTPVSIRVPYSRPVQIRLEHAGFEDSFLRAKGSDASPVQRLLQVKPTGLLKLPEEPVTGVGSGDSLGVIGLRGGLLLGINLVTGEEAYRRNLAGLDEILGTPLVNGTTCVFATTHGRLQAIRIQDGRMLWSKQVEHGVRTELAIVSGGVVYANGKGDIVCHDLATGDELWSKITGVQPQNDPVWDGEFVWYAGRTPMLMALDVAEPDMPVVKRADVPGTIGKPIRVGRAIAFYATDGSIHAYEPRQNGRAEWVMPVATAGSDGHLLADPAGVLFVGEDGTVRRLDPATKTVVKERKLSGRVIVPPLRTDAAIFCCLEGEKGAATVVSLDATSLNLRWSYTIAGGLRGHPTLHGRTLCVVGGDRRIHRLQ